MRSTRRIRASRGRRRLRTSAGARRIAESTDFLAGRARQGLTLRGRFAERRIDDALVDAGASAKPSQGAELLSDWTRAGPHGPAAGSSARAARRRTEPLGVLVRGRYVG